MTYGNVGSQERLDFTVIGQPANIAARLGDHGKAIGEHIVMTEDIASGAVNARPLGPLRLYNISQPVVSYAMSSRDTQSLTPELILPPQASEGVSMDHMPG